MWRDKLVYISKKVALIKKEDREKSVDKRNSDVKKTTTPPCSQSTSLGPN